MIRLKSKIRKTISIAIAFSMLFGMGNFDLNNLSYAEDKITKEESSEDMKETEKGSREKLIVDNEDNTKIATSSIFDEINDKADDNIEMASEEAEEEELSTLSDAVVAKDDINSIDEEKDKTNDIENVDIQIISSDSETDNNDININGRSDESINEYDIVSTESETILDERDINVATDNDLMVKAYISTVSEVRADYFELDTLSQILYQDNDSAFLNGDVITLTKDIELSDTVYFKEGKGLDLAGHAIVGPKEHFAIYVEGNFTLSDTADGMGKIEGRCEEFPTIYMKDATAEFISGKIYGAKGTYDSDNNGNLNGGDAIHIYDSSVTFSGAIVEGGEGMESDSLKGGNGGDAIVVLSARSDDFINISDGKITGGQGADGVGEKNPKKGAALVVDGKVYEGVYFGKGLPGSNGGGDGGVALNIKTKKMKSQNLWYSEYVLNAGHSGYSKVESVNEENINSNLSVLDETSLGAGVNDSYYSLHDVDGTNYITSIKGQSSTGLCTAFAAVAYAETALIKNYPEYVTQVLNKNIDKTLDQETWVTNDNELNLSEMYFGMQLFTQPKDEFGNAGLSKYVYDVSNESRWPSVGSNSWSLAFTSTTWRPFVEEDSAIAWPSANADNLMTYPIDRNLLNKYTDKTVVHAKNAKIHDASEYFKGKVFDRDAFIEQMKRDILEYDGVVTCMYTGNKSEFADFGNGTYSYEKNGVSYGDYLHSLGTPELIKKVNANINGLGGHALYVIGWDDNVTWTDSRGTHTGAFLCKNSWSTFTLLSYDNSFALYYGADADDGKEHLPNQFVDYLTIDFVPAFSEYENNYYYDSGVGLSYVDQEDGVVKNTLSYDNVGTYGTVDYNLAVQYRSVANTFEIKNDKEKIKAVSFFASEVGEYEITVYRVSTLTNTNTLSTEIKDGSIISSKVVNATIGYNTIDVDENDLTKGSKVLVKVKRLDKDNFGKVYYDSNEDSTYLIGTNRHGSKYETDEKGRSFLLDPIVKINEIKNAGNVYEIGTSEYDNLYEIRGIGDSIVNSVSNKNSTKISTLNGGANARIRLITNNFITLNANGEGKFNNGENITYVYPRLRMPIGNIEEPTPNSNDNIFIGYNDKADCTGTNYDSSTMYKLKIADSLTLYANYASGDEQVTLRFTTDSGTGVMNDMTRPTGTSIIVPGSNYKKTGYEFVEWTDDNGNEVQVGSSIVLDTDVTLKAKWRENEYPIEYEMNGGDFVSGYTDYPTSRKYTENKILPDSSKISKTGYEFNGWFDNENYTGAAVTETSVANTEATAMFYAKWKPITYTIKYNAGGGTINTSSFIKTYDIDVEDLETPTRTNYAFAGWYIDEELTTPYNKKDLSTLKDVTKIIYAKWNIVNTVTFEFDTKHGNKPLSQYVVNGDKLEKPNGMSAIGYRFLYWYEDDENVEFDFEKSIEVTETTTRTLHAKWEVLAYKVTLNVGEGTINSGNVTSYTYGVGAMLPKDVTPKKSNTVFVGWYLDSSFSGSVVTVIKGTDAGDKVFYARYETISNGNSGGRTGSSGTSGGSGGMGGGRVVANLGALDTVATPLANAEKVAEAANRETKIETSMKDIPISYNTAESEWKSDSDGDRHLTLKNENGEVVEAKNTFACIVTTHKDSEGKEFEVQDFYYFDKDGKMYLGWLIDTANTTYYFEAEPGDEHGKLARGWTEIGDGYYYFDGNGVLQTNTTTPDGYNVGSDGKWVKESANKSNDSNVSEKRVGTIVEK